MCGRARCTLNHQDVARACGIDGSPKALQLERYSPSYNVSPGFYLPVLRKEQGSQAPVLHCMKWGLVPSFTKKSEKPDHFKMFNARSESVCEKASFRRLVPNNRCLVAVEGFYEWKKDGAKKQPYYIHFKDNRPMVFAALYDVWESLEGESLYTFTILTTCCSSALQWLHDRMPVILGDKDMVNAWVNSSPSSKIDALLRPYEDSDLVWYPVTPAMGKPSFNGPECIKEIQLKPENSISKFFSKAKGDNYHKPEQCIKSPTDSSALRDLSGNPKKELDFIENEEFLVKSELDAEDSKFEAQLLLLSEGAEKCGTKRDFQHFSDVSDLANTEDVKPWKLSPHPPRSPVKQKGNPRSEGGKQPTLFSYFGKS